MNTIIKRCSQTFVPSILASAVAMSLSAGAHSAVSDLIEEVRVMAQKKSASEAVQDVPISITAYSGDKVDAMFAVNLTDIGLNTPNANLTPLATSPGVANFVIRGMGTVGQSIPSADPAVGVVMDGISYGTIFGVVTDLFDLESIEVLRGPQGTLFGRNVTGGAISMRSTRPGDEFEGRIRGTLGSHNRKDVSVVVSGPLNDNWGAKLAVMSKDHDGYWDNKTLGGESGAAESLLIRPAVSYTGDGYDATLIMEYGHMEGDGLATRQFVNSGGQFADPYDSDDTIQDYNGDSDLKWVNVMLETNWDLWDGQLTSVLGYRDLEQDTLSDVDGGPGTLYHFGDGTNLEQDQISLEVRWAGEVNDYTSLTAGVYLFDQEYTYSARQLLLDSVDRRAVSTIEHSTAGIFAQADFALHEDLTLTLGGRYSQEFKDAAIGNLKTTTATNCQQIVLGPGDSFAPKADLSNCEQEFNDDESWSNFSPKVGLTWDVTDDIMAFASFSRGFRSGGYNVRYSNAGWGVDPNAASPGPYDEEVVDAIEVGVKSTWLDGRARVNVSLFQNEYDDLQRTTLATNGDQEIINAATATIRGLEVDTVLMLSENLVFEASAGWVDAAYDEYDFAENHPTNPVEADALNFNMVPEFTSNMAITYDQQLGDIGTLTYRLAYSFVNQTFADDLNTLPVDQYELYDGSIVFNNAEGNLKVALFGRNLKDEIYYDFGVNVSSLGFVNYYQTPPRTYGIELTYDF